MNQTKIEDINNSKKIFRKELILKRKSISNTRRDLANKGLVTDICNDAMYIESQNVLLFASYGDEISLWSLFERVIQDGKYAYFPLVKDQNMIFLRVCEMSDFHEGYMGILEPNEFQSEFDGAYEKSIILLPGLGFDNMGGRIGYGKGFYDRYLRNNPSLIPRSIAVGFKEQLCEKLPMDEYDIRPARIKLY